MKPFRPVRFARWMAGTWAGLRAFAAFAAARARQDNLPGVAASLAYTSLLALVPLIAIGFAILTAFPAFDSVRSDFQSWALTTFLPATGQSVQEALNRFIHAAGRLTTVGVAGLAVTAMLMLMTIERAFNGIFRVVRPRPLIIRLLVYWVLLTLGPILAGSSTGLAGYLAATATAAGRSLGAPEVAGLWARVSWVVPILLSAAFCALLYVTVPNRRVALRDAAIGALIAAGLIAALRLGFVRVVVGGKTYQTLYGALAVVPLFLLWTYLSWLAVLAGAGITAALPEWRHHRHVARVDPDSQRLVLILDILALLAEAAAQGKGLTRGSLLDRTAAAESGLMAELELLHAKGFVARADDGKWLLLRPLAAATLGELLAAVGLGLPAPREALRRRWDGPVRAALDAGRSQAAQALNLPLASLLEGAAPGGRRRRRIARPQT